MMNARLKHNGSRPPEEWGIRRPFHWGHALVICLLMAALAYSADRTDIGEGVAMSTDAALTGLANLVGFEREPSAVGRGISSFAQRSWPIVVSRERRVDDLGRNFDPDADMPWWSHIETRPHPVTGEPIEYLVQPVGYLTYVVGLMVTTIEIAIWGTLLALFLAIPLTYCSASNYTPHPLLYVLGRSLCSLSRAVPELISALIFVVLFGVGPFAGVLALGFHTAGFLGKFFADDIENADRGPQEALHCSGANPVKVLRFAVLPQIMPQVFAYVQYILERNVRTATVLGIVGAGGIGLELIGQWNMYKYGHAATILLVIFVTVVILEHITQRLRRRII